MKTTGAICLWMMVLISLAGAVPSAPLRPQLYDRVLSLMPQQANNAPLAPFITTTLDPRSRSTGTTYIAVSAKNQYRPTTIALYSYDLNADGFPGQNDRNTVLAGTNLPLTQTVSPVANKQWILYDFDPQNALPWGSLPLLAYNIGWDGIPSTADDLGIFPVAIDHVPGSTTKDIDEQTMIYTFLMPDFNNTGILNSDVILHNMGQNGMPDNDDIVTLITHLQGLGVASEVHVVRNRFSVLFVGGRLDLYDLGLNGVYERQAGDDAWVSFSTGNPSVREHDLSERYMAYLHATPPNPIKIVSVYDIGPDNLLNTADDANTILFPGVAMPRVSVGINVARLAFVGTLGNSNVIYLINAGSDLLFGTTDDTRQLIPIASSITSLTLEGDTLIWEDNTGIKFYRTSR